MSNSLKNMISIVRRRLMINCTRSSQFVLYSALHRSILFKQANVSFKNTCKFLNSVQLYNKPIYFSLNLKLKSHQKTIWSWDIVTSILIFLGVIDDTITKDSPMILCIKKGILAKQRKQYHKAEMHLHNALRMAQELCDTDAETYIFDVMADNYFEKEEFSKARDLYLEVISRLSQKEDFHTDCEELVEISLKLAYCFGKLGQIDSSEKGFQFSIDTQLKRTDKFWNNKMCKLTEADVLDDSQLNSLALLGMSYDYYSKYLQHCNNLLEKSLSYRLKALEISKAVNGDCHEQTLILENDIADLYVQLNDLSKAKGHLRNAVNGAKMIDSFELPVYYLNMASIYHLENRKDLAQPLCQQTLNFLFKTKFEIDENDKKILQEKSEQCLNGLKFY